MKHSLTRLLVLLLGLLPALFCLPARAQSAQALRQRLDYVLANLDKSQVPTGRLLEAAEPLAWLPPFDGRRLDDTSRTTLPLWRGLYATAASGRVAGADTLPGLLTVNQRLAAARPAAPGAGPVPIAVQYLTYARVRPDAFSANLLSVQNEQVYDVSGRPQSPYQTQVLFAAAPAYSFSPTGYVSFVFRRNLYLADGTSGTVALYLDADNGQGYRAVSWNQPISLTYTTAGNKHLKVKAVYTPDASAPTDGGRGPAAEVRESHFTFEVLNAGVAARYATDSISRGFTRRISPSPGVHGGALVSVRYGRGNSGGKRILKPLIIVEQYNIASTAPHLIHCNNPNNTAETFLAAIGDNTNPFDLNNKLDLAGYDLVYIDFLDNLDYLANNAKVFEEVVRWVNQKKQAAGSTEKNVVMGLSMGGLIARYGLADMTKNPTSPYGPPDTRLLVLHDSPQRGAYNPLGVQAITRSLSQPILGSFTLGDFNDEFKETVAVMNAGATRDLSILYATDGTGGVAANTFLTGSNSPYRQKITFTAQDPPPAYEIVATSDGSQCGIPQGIAPSTQLSNTQQTLLGQVSALDYHFLRGDIAAYALPAYGQQAPISHVRLLYSYLLFAGVPLTIFIPLRWDEATSPPNTLPYESLPGGTAHLSESADCANTLSYGAPPLYFSQTHTTFYGGPICFVPTYSALDVEPTTTGEAYALYVNNLASTANRPTPARFIAQQPSSTTASDYNLTHLQYTARNGEWLFNEMQRPFAVTDDPNPLACNASGCDPAADKTIIGPLTLCVDRTRNPAAVATYTSPIQGAGYTYAWTVDDCSLVTTCSGTGPTFQTADAANAGNVTLTLTVRTPCVFTFHLQLIVGAPALGWVEDPGNSSPCYYIAAYRITPFDPAVRYTARGTMGLGYGGRFRVKGSGGAVKAFSITADNGCGSVTVDDAVYFERCNAPQGRTYTVYPNPASEEVTVSQDGGDEPAAQRGSAPAAGSSAGSSGSSSGSGSGGFEVRVFDGYGTLRHAVSTPTGRVQLPTGLLPVGLYVLVIVETDTGAVVRRQLEVAR